MLNNKDLNHEITTKKGKKQTMPYFVHVAIHWNKI